MSGVSLQAAGSRAGSLCHLGEIRTELNPLEPSPGLGAWVLLPTLFMRVRRLRHLDSIF